jgi:hypothetical protein
MRYPALSYTKADELAVKLILGESPTIASEVTWTGSGEEIDLGLLDDTVKDLKTKYLVFLGSGEGEQPEVFEGLAAGDLHLALRDLPIEILDDPGFWRYVSVAKLWWFIEEREAGPIGRGNHMTYIDGGRPTECVPLRMFLRAQAICDGDDYSLASSMKNATDFWRSHVIRVQTGTAPPLARSFTSLQARVRMPSTPELRPFARRVNRLWSNVVLNRLDEEETTRLMEELYETRPVSEPDNDVAS